MGKWNLLQRMWVIQKRPNKDLLNLDDAKRHEKSKHMVLAMHSECTEFLEELNWAPQKVKKEIIRSNLLEELIDILKYWVNLCLIWKFSPMEVFDEFKRKSLVVEQKMKQKELLIRLRRVKKVCALDLDGTVVDYPRCWVKYINRRLKKEYKDLDEIKIKVNKRLYLKLKHEYRESGYKRYLPRIRGADKFTATLRRKGYKIVILTKRPYKKYARIFSDTMYWLNKNNIRFDAILFDSQKHKRIVSELPNLAFMVEDNRKVANEVAEWGYNSFLVDNKYNKGNVHNKVTRVKNYSEILDIV